MILDRQGVVVAVVAGISAAATGSVRADGATETALYLLVFDATWSADTHPDDFPGSAHFSGLIGGTHNGDVAFWEDGELASDGIESMAETGSKTLLRAEVQQAIDGGNAGEVISGPGISRSPGTALALFVVTQEFPLATVVSMIAPSPDWFVGVDGTLLFRDGDWVDELVVELPPLDAGTDSGVSYRSANQDTQPPEPIAEITGYPFFNEKEERVPPLGTFTFTRVDQPCPEDLDESGDVGFGDLLILLAAWGPCEGDCPEDLDDDNDVDFDDLLILLSAWGPCE